MFADHNTSSRTILMIALAFGFIGVLYTVGTAYAAKRLYREWLAIALTSITSLLMLAAFGLALAGCVECGASCEVDSAHDAAPTIDSAMSTFHIAGMSSDVTWECIVDRGMPCPWGATLHNQAVVWPIVGLVAPANNRLGYITSSYVYLLSAVAHVRVTITSGSAILYAGNPDQLTKFPALAALSAGQSYDVTSINAGMVLSVESTGDAFGYEVESL